MNIFHRDRDLVKIVESWRENGRRERRDHWERRREGSDRRQLDLRAGVRVVLGDEPCRSFSSDTMITLNFQLVSLRSVLVWDSIVVWLV